MKSATPLITTPTPISPNYLTSSSKLIDEDLKGSFAETEYRDISYTEMMSYYTPKWVAYAGFVASIFASLSLPCFGFVLSRYIFLLAKLDSPSPPSGVYYARDIWTAIFVALCCAIGMTTYT
jgi:hypothetical protein